MANLIDDLRAEPGMLSEPITLNRNDYLIREGVVERNFYLIESGALRIFYLTEFEEHTIRFGYEGSLITSLGSWFTGRPSEFYIQAIRKCTLRRVKRSDFDAFLQGSPERMDQYQKMLEALFVQQLDREIDLLTHSPVERYQRVLERSPKLFQEVPARYIASYLRMTPETLSRIRKS